MKQSYKVFVALRQFISLFESFCPSAERPCEVVCRGVQRPDDAGSSTLVQVLYFLRGFVSNTFLSCCSICFSKRSVSTIDCINKLTEWGQCCVNVSAAYTECSCLTALKKLYFLKLPCSMTRKNTHINMNEWLIRIFTTQCWVRHTHTKCNKNNESILRTDCHCVSLPPCMLSI